MLFLYVRLQIRKERAPSRTIHKRLVGTKRRLSGEKRVVNITKPPFVRSAWRRNSDHKFTDARHCITYDNFIIFFGEMQYIGIYLAEYPKISAGFWQYCTKEKGRAGRTESRALPGLAACGAAVRQAGNRRMTKRMTKKSAQKQGKKGEKEKKSS